MTKPKRTPGRRPLPLVQQRRKPVSVSLTDAEYAEMKRLAGKQPLSAYLREKGLGLS